MSLAGRVFSDAFDFTSVMALFVVVYSGTTKVTESVDDDALPGTFAKLGAAGQSLVLATVIATVAVDEGDMFKKQAAKNEAAMADRHDLHDMDVVLVAHTLAPEQWKRNISSSRKSELHCAHTRFAVSASPYHNLGCACCEVTKAHGPTYGKH